MYLLRLLHVLRLGPASANYGLWAESSSFIHALSVAAFLLVYQSRGIVTETGSESLIWSIRPGMI